MSDAERRLLMESMIAEVHIYEDRQPNGQWLKSIRFRLPIIKEYIKFRFQTVADSCFWRGKYQNDGGIFIKYLHMKRNLRKIYGKTPDIPKEYKRYFDPVYYHEGKEDQVLQLAQEKSDVKEAAKIREILQMEEEQ